MVSHLQGQTGLQTGERLHNSRAGCGTRACRKLEVACWCTAACRRHCAVEGPCHANCSAFQGRRKRRQKAALSHLSARACTHAQICPHMHDSMHVQVQTRGSTLPSSLSTHNLSQSLHYWFPRPYTLLHDWYLSLLVLTPLFLHLLHEFQKVRSQKIL